MRRPLAGGVWLVCIASLPAAAARDLVIADGRLVDGTGAPPRERVTIGIHDDRIVEIGTTVAAPADATTLDASGLWGSSPISCSCAAIRWPIPARSRPSRGACARASPGRLASG